MNEQQENNQLNLFSDKICSNCKKNPGCDEENNLRWNGFYDRDTNEYVCNNCKKLHYQKKFKTEFAGLYTEFPVYAIGYFYE